MAGKKEFYKELMNHKEREMRTRISLLDWATENTVRNIEGRVTDGNIAIDGNSPVRRSCSLTMVVDKNLTSGQERISDLISINKKVQIHVGLKNTTQFKEMGEYVWFNLGLYVLTDVTYMHDLDNATINITALDKMCLWSGDIAGEFQETVDIHKYTQIKKDGTREEVYLTYYDIVHRLASVFGKQNPGKIMINGVEQKIRRVIQKSTPGELYFSKKDNAYLPSLDGVDKFEVVSLTKGDYVYTYEDFKPNIDESDTYTIAVGQTITQALDLVKSALGNYEYFFDLDGNFIFQEIKNFQNTTYASNFTSMMSLLSTYGEDDNMDYDELIKPIQSVVEGDYITNFSQTPYTYSFEDSEIATAFTNTPDWKGIKNNFVVYGGAAGGKMLHIAIDKKPVSPSIWYVDDSELAEAVMAPEFYIGIRNSSGLWGIYADNEFNLAIKKLEGDTVPQHIFQDSILLKDHLTEDYSRVVIENGKLKFKDEFFPGTDTYYNGVIIKSQYGCECLLHSYDSYPKLIKPYRFLNFMQGQNGKVYLIYPNSSDKLVIEETNEKYFTNIFDATATPLPEYLPKREFLLLDNKRNSKKLKLSNELRLYVEDTTETAEKENFFVPNLRGGGVNIVIYNDRLQFEQSTVRAIPYNQPWQQYIIDLGDSIRGTAAADVDIDALLPDWYHELKANFPLIYKRNDNYWGGNWLKAYSPSGEPIYEGMGDTSIWPYYFDIIDENTELGKYSIGAIGKRTKAVAEEDITMLYPPIRRNYCMLTPSETEDRELMDWLLAKEQPYLILKEDEEFKKHFTYAAYGKDAFTKIRELIYLHTNMNETVNITSMPLYFLEPNTKIIAKDEETHTTGDYVIININLPLQFDAQQTIACMKVGSRL